MCPTKNCGNAVVRTKEERSWLVQGSRRTPRLVCCSVLCQLLHKENQTHLPAHKRQQAPRPRSMYVGVHAVLAVLFEKRTPDRKTREGAARLKWRFKAGQRLSPGFFCTPEEAAGAYDEVARQLSSAAVCNFESTDAAESAIKAAIADWEKQTSQKWEKRVGFRGVMRNGHKWQSRLELGIHFATKDAACEAYEKAARVLQNNAADSSGADSGSVKTQQSITTGSPKKNRKSNGVGRPGHTVRQPVQPGFLSFKRSARGVQPKSQCRGVGRCRTAQKRGKVLWHARLQLGSFRTEEEAAAVYDDAARRCLGEVEKWRLNYGSREMAAKEAAKAVAAYERMHPHELLQGAPVKKANSNPAPTRKKATRRKRRPGPALAPAAAPNKRMRSGAGPITATHADCILDVPAGCSLRRLARRGGLGVLQLAAKRKRRASKMCV